MIILSLFKKDRWKSCIITGLKAITYPKTILETGFFFAICSRFACILANILVKKTASQKDDL